MVYPLILFSMQFYPPTMISKPTEDFDISFCDDFSKVKEKIIFQLISYDKTKSS